MNFVVCLNPFLNLKPSKRLISIVLGFVFFYFGIAYCYAQNEPKDTNPKLVELKNYLTWSTNYASQKLFDSAHHYIQRAEILSEEIGNPQITANVQINTAKILYWQNRTVEAKKLLNENIKSVDIDDSLKLKSHDLLSEIYNYKHEFAQSLKHSIEAEKIVRSKIPMEKKDSLHLSFIYVGMGNVYEATNNLSKAIEYYKRAINHAKDSEYRSWTTYLLSRAYQKDSAPYEAIKFAHQALNLGIKNKEKVYLPSYYAALSEYHLQLKNADSAIYYAKEGLRDNKDCQLDLLHTKAGQALMYQNNVLSATNSFEKALKYSTNIDNDIIIHNALRDAYGQLKQYDKAFDHNNLYISLKDSLNDLKVKQELHEITEKYESDKKELEISILNADNQHNTYVIEKQKSQLLLIILLVFLLIGILLLIVYFFFRQKKQKELLYAKNRQLVQRLKYSAAVVDDGLQTQTDGHSKNHLSIDLKQREKIHEAIQNAITHEYFLNKDVSLSAMAHSLDTNTTYLSKIINDDFKKPFVHFLNDHRVAYILKNLETDPTYRRLTVDHLADKAGFASSSAFYKAFKRFTGLTPSYYIKKQLQEI